MRILVIEDEYKIANSIKKGLEQERYAADVAYNGSDGFDLAAVEQYDLIVLDLMLPGMDGITLLRKLRDKKIYTPVLIVTAKGQIEDKVQGLDSGADDYLTKPFSFEELLARVKALTRRPKNYLGSVLTAKDLTLDTLSYEVKRAGRNIRLSGKEFALLEYLMRNQDKILTKDQIIFHVWNYDADILPNTVEVTIRNLRQKIDQPFKNTVKLIQTLRGFGYKIGGQ